MNEINNNQQLNQIKRSWNPKFSSCLNVILHKSSLRAKQHNKRERLHQISSSLASFSGQLASIQLFCLHLSQPEVIVGVACYFELFLNKYGRMKKKSRSSSGLITAASEAQGRRNATFPAPRPPPSRPAGWQEPFQRRGWDGGGAAPRRRWRGRQSEEDSRRTRTRRRSGGADRKVMKWGKKKGC